MTTFRPKDVDAYIALYPGTTQDLLKALRSTIKTAAPDATETILYGIPAYKYHGVLVCFAAYGRHLALHLTTQSLTPFRRELIGYTTAKSSIQFPVDRPLPLELIGSIVAARYEDHIRRGRWKRK